MAAGQSKRGDRPRIASEARALLQELLAAGDDGAVHLSYEASEMVASMVEQDLVEVEMLGRSMAVRLKRYDKK